MSTIRDTLLEKAAAFDFVGTQLTGELPTAESGQGRVRLQPLASNDALQLVLSELPDTDNLRALEMALQWAKNKDGVRLFAVEVNDTVTGLLFTNIYFDYVFGWTAQTNPDTDESFTAGVELAQKLNREAKAIESLE